MNPAWVLLKPEWKLLYDKLMASDRLDVQKSMAVWYPDDVRKRIDEITTKYPKGFAQKERESGVADLAELDLKRFTTKIQGRRKLKRALLDDRMKLRSLVSKSTMSEDSRSSIHGRNYDRMSTL